MKFQFIAAFLMMQMSSSAAFAPNTCFQTSTSSSSVRLNAIPTPEESAQALTNYMAKAHEAKIEALKDLESKKNAEIKALKENLAGSSGGIVQSTPESSASASGESAEDLAKKLLSYQKFMSDYIVKAQEDKARAVAEAQAAITKKYEDKLNAFMLNAAPVNGVDAPAVAVMEAAKETKLYQERNAKIKAAAAAGKTRWGDKEVEKVGAQAPTSKVITAAPVADVSASATPPPEVVAADHGLRADGGVGGLSLAERVANGAAAAAPAASAPTSSALAVDSLFQKRNARISAAANAGKQTRWGGMEVAKAIDYSSNALPAAPKIEILPEVEAADHGLRADGGVGGPSLAERVNLGAKLLSQ